MARLSATTNSSIAGVCFAGARTAINLLDARDVQIEGNRFNGVEQPVRITARDLQCDRDKTGAQEGYSIDLQNYRLPDDIPFFGK